MLLNINNWDAYNQFQSIAVNMDIFLLSVFSVWLKVRD